MSIEITPTLLQESQARSVDYFSDPHSYSGFSFTRDLKHIIGCIEPRDPAHETHGSYKTIKQTPGGSVGEGLDQATATYAVDKTEITIDTGMDRNANLRPLRVFDAHDDCKFDQGIVDIAKEMGSPSEFTRESVVEWARFFNSEDHVRLTMPLIMVAAGVQVKLLETDGGRRDLIKRANELFPAHTNVYPVKQPALAGVYVVNFHPDIGKDRNMKPSDPAEALLVQGYHDGLAANASDLAKSWLIDRSLRDMRFTALLLRSAATRTVISRGKMAEMVFLDVLPDSDDAQTGLKIVPRDFTQYEGLAA